MKDESSHQTLESLHILQVGPLPPPPGGIAHHVYALAKSLVDAGANCTVLDINDNPIGDPPSMPIPGRASLFGLVFFSKAKVVHIHADSHDLHYHAPPAILAAKLSRKQIVLSIHSGEVEKYFHAQKPGKRKSMKRSIRSADTVIADNSEIQEFAKSFRTGKSKPVILPTFFHNPGIDEAALSEKLGSFIEDHRPLLISCGALRPLYGFDTIVEAVAIAVNSNPDIGLILTVTDTVDEKQLSALEEKIKSFSLADHVRIEIQLTHGQYLTALRRANIFIRATTADGDALSVREAMAENIPVIATDTGMRPEGVVPFPVRDAKALADCLEETLKKKSHGNIKKDKQAEDILEPFIDIYMG